MKNNQLIKILLLCGLLLVLATVARKDLLPAVEEIDQSLYLDPTQIRTSQKPFKKEVNEISYIVQPLYNYELYGMVVSYHNSDTWWDIYHHRSWQDYLNIRDLCVVWGQNVETGAYLDMTYDSDNWTCFYMTSDQRSAKIFRNDQLSNNHLLNANKDIQDLIMDVSIGDQIRLKGQLVNYGNLQNKMQRGTSVSRKDTGNGACETIYVEEFEIIKENNHVWRTTYLAGKWMIILSLVFFVLNFLFGDVADFTKK